MGYSHHDHTPTESNKTCHLSWRHFLFVEFDSLQPDAEHIACLIRQLGNSYIRLYIVHSLLRFLVSVCLEESHLPVEALSRLLHILAGILLDLYISFLIIFTTNNSPVSIFLRISFHSSSEYSIGFGVLISIGVLCLVESS